MHRARAGNLWFGETALLGAIGLAWAALAAWQLSPYHASLSHAQLADAPLGPSRQLALLLGGWTLMTVAMMLPASLPFFARVRLVVARRPSADTLVGLAVVGYLLVWLLLGVGFNLGDLALHRVIAAGAPLHPLAELVAPLIFAVAGVWQIVTAQRYFFYRPYLPGWIDLTAHPRWGALRGGARHGLDCAGSCWPLMLVMFAIGHGSLLLMVVLGGLVILQKNVPLGQQLRTMVGVLLLVQAAMLALAG